MALVLSTVAATGVHGISQAEADTIVADLESQWLLANENGNWTYLLEELYCPNFVTVPNTGSDLFLTADNIVDAWEANAGPEKDVILGVQIIPSGEGNPLLLEIGEQISARDLPSGRKLIDILNYSVLWGVCDESGKYKILIDTWEVTAVRDADEPLSSVPPPPDLTPPPPELSPPQSELAPPPPELAPPPPELTPPPPALAPPPPV